MKVKMMRILNIRNAWFAAVLLLAILLPGNIQVESRQIPSPPRDTIQNKESNTKQQAPTHDSNGTDQSPLVVKILKTQQDDDATRDEEKERSRKANVERWTIILSIITAIILFFQLIVFSRQARRLKETIDEIKVTTKATQEAAKAATAQTAVATKEFISTHRPRLIVRNVTIKPPSHPSLPIEPGVPIQVEWAVVNLGDTPCEIIESNATLLVGGQTFYARTPFSPARDSMNGVKLAPGGAFTFLLQSDQIDFENAGQLHSLNNGEKVIYFFGFIMYRDDIGNIRRTAFSRRYDPAAERFTVINDPDYEYTD